MLALALMAATPAALRSSQVDPDEEHVQQHLWCPCGCNQVLGSCNHIGCASAPPMRAEVRGLLDQDLDPEQVLARFKDKYGPTIRTAPSTEGWFDLSAWLAPFAGLVIGGAVFAVAVRRFRRRGPSVPSEEPANPEAARHNRRMEEDLENFVPED
jgi:cytochrome c-type biogenesis protein CcmH